MKFVYTSSKTKKSYTEKLMDDSSSVSFISYGPES